MTIEFIQAARAGGLRLSKVETGRLMRCPVEGDRGTSKSGWYRVFDDDYPCGVWGNWKTGESGSWSARRTMSAAERAAYRSRIQQAEQERQADQERQWRLNLARNEKLLADSFEITPGDAVALYLKSRGLEIPQGPHGLRYAPNLPYFDGKTRTCHPAMLAAVVSIDNKLVSVHRTFLVPTGGKAHVAQPKKLMPISGAMAGAAVRIGQPFQASDGVALAVAEGIETALAVTALHGVPCWAAVSAGGLQAFEWPREVTALLVCGDNDASQTGQRAAQELARRAANAGLVVRVCIPTETGTDWADTLQEGW